MSLRTSCFVIGTFNDHLAHTGKLLFRRSPRPSAGSPSTIVLARKKKTKETLPPKTDIRDPVLHPPYSACQESRPSTDADPPIDVLRRGFQASG